MRDRYRRGLPNILACYCFIALVNKVVVVVVDVFFLFFWVRAKEFQIKERFSWKPGSIFLSWHNFARHNG